MWEKGHCCSAKDDLPVACIMITLYSIYIMEMMVYIYLLIYIVLVDIYIVLVDFFRT